MLLNKKGDLTSPALILEAFNNEGQGLVFTHELPDATGLQFLDLKLTFGVGHVCWAYQPRALKQLLPFDSAHSKVVKRAVGSLCLESALRKSCEHQMRSSFSNQVGRLLAAGFPLAVVNAIAESLLQKVKLEHEGQEQRSND